jgi:hypothetical protein
MNGATQALMNGAILMGTVYGWWIGRRSDNRGEVRSLAALLVAVLTSITWFGLGRPGGDTTAAFVLWIGVLGLIVVGFALPDKPGASKLATRLLNLSLVWALVGGWCWVGLRETIQWFGWLGNTYDFPLWLMIILVVLAFGGFVWFVRGIVRFVRGLTAPAPQTTAPTT